MATINYGHNTVTAKTWPSCSDGTTIGALVSDGDYGSVFMWFGDEVHPDAIIDLGSSVSRHIHLRHNYRDSGVGNFTAFYRCSDTSFDITKPPGDGVPSWNLYKGAFTDSHRYFDWRIVAGDLI